MSVQKPSSSSHQASARELAENDAKMLAQIHRNEIRIKELERLRSGHEFEIKVKSDKLAELCREHVTKTAELAKSREIEKNLQVSMAAARQSAHTVRSMAECQMSMMPQFRAQLAQIDQQQANRREEILAKHVRTYEHQLTAYDSREDVTALRALQAQLADAQIALDDLTQQLSDRQLAQRKQRSAHTHNLHQRIVRMAGDALRQRDLSAQIATMSARHRQVRERIEQRQQLLQCYERRRHDLHARLAQLKKNQAMAFLDDIESCPVLMRPLVAVGGGGGCGGCHSAVDTTVPSKAATAEGAASASAMVAVSSASNDVGLTSTSVTTAKAASTTTTTSTTAPEDDPDCLETSLDQMSISQQMRRVRFNPTDSVRAIAANGDGSESEESSAYRGMSGTAVRNESCDGDGTGRAADTETEQDVLNSNDSFMCALAANENVLMEVDAAMAGVATASTSSQAVGGEEAASTTSATDANNESNPLNLSMGDGELSEGFLGNGFELFDNDNDGDDGGAVDGDHYQEAAGDAGAPPAKRAKLMRVGSKVDDAAESEAANLNTSFGSMVPTSELNFEFVGFEEEDDEGAANVSSRANSLFNFDLEQDVGAEYNGEGDLF